MANQNLQYKTELEKMIIIYENKRYGDVALTELVSKDAD